MGAPDPFSGTLEMERAAEALDEFPHKAGDSQHNEENSQHKHTGGWIGVTTVRELYGVMAARGAAGGYVVASGQFTAEARCQRGWELLGLLEVSGLSRHAGYLRMIAVSPAPTFVGTYTDQLFPMLVHLKRI